MMGAGRGHEDLLHQSKAIALWIWSNSKLSLYQGAKRLSTNRHCIPPALSDCIWTIHRPPPVVCEGKNFLSLLMEACVVKDHSVRMDREFQTGKVWEGCPVDSTGAGDEKKGEEKLWQNASPLCSVRTGTTVCCCSGVEYLWFCWWRDWGLG